MCMEFITRFKFLGVTVDSIEVLTSLDVAKLAASCQEFFTVSLVWFCLFPLCGTKQISAHNVICFFFIC